MALPCLRLFTGFMLLLSLQPGLGAPLKAYLRVCTYFERDVESRPATNVICLFCSRIIWQTEAVTQTRAAKVTERCRALS